ncbi:MAG TPA: cell division protein FtsB [Methylococcus sp.]|nr:cell division protein FtsB [Methylococcus sp.]
MKKLSLLLIALIALLQYRLWFGDGNLLELHRLQKRIAELTEEGERRRQRNAVFEAEVRNLRDGTEAIEERARRDLGMIKEGEIFVQIIDAAHPEPAPPTPAARKPVRKSSGTTKTQQRIETEGEER